MRFATAMATAVVLAVVSASVRAQPGKPGSPTKPPAAVTTGPIEDRVLPELAFDEIALDDVMAFLGGTVPGMNPVIVRDRGVPEDFPKLRFHAKNVTVGQFLDFLRTSYEGIAIESIDGPAGALYVVRIRAVPANVMPHGMGAGEGMGARGYGAPVAGAVPAGPGAATPG